MANLSTFFRCYRRGAIPWRRIILGLVMLVIAFVLYALSFGQVLRHYHAPVGRGWGERPPWARTFYAPLKEVGGWLPRFYDHYIYSCLIDEPPRKHSTP